jgi:LemA protein
LFGFSSHGNRCFELRTFPGVLWASTFFRSNKPMTEFTATDNAQSPPQVKF